MKILIICTGNSCRSQMAHGFLQSFDNKLDVFSAGTKHAEKVNPMEVRVMDEIKARFYDFYLNELKLQLS